MIKEFFARRRAARDERDFNRGYDYAAGALLRGTSIDELEAEADGMQYATAFDLGMSTAIRDWEAHCGCGKLVDLVRRLTLATNEGDDKAQGTHYVAKDGAIRCKGSFLALIEEARAAIRDWGSR